MCVCVCVVCIAVPIVRWRSVRCAAVRRPLSSSLLALWQASRQLPEMQDSALGKEILVLSPSSLCPTSTTHPLLRPATTKCSQNAMQERTDISSTLSVASFFRTTTAHIFTDYNLVKSVISGMMSCHTNPKLKTRPESSSLSVCLKQLQCLF